MPEEPLPPLYEDTSKFDWRVLARVGAVTAVAVAAALLWLGAGPEQSSAPAAPETLPPLDEAARAYRNSVEISGLQPSKWKNMLGQEVVYLEGTLTNSGGRTLRAVELTIEFQDVYGQLVRREKFRPVGAPPASAIAKLKPPLPPGKSREFRAGFERVPPSWNQRTPAVRITGLLLEESPDS